MIIGVHKGGYRNCENGPYIGNSGILLTSEVVNALRWEALRMKAEPFEVQE
jgi:hypothetical protein